MRRWRVSSGLAPLVPTGLLVDEAVAALVLTLGVRLVSRGAVNAVDIAEEHGLAVGGRGEARIRRGERGTRHRLDQIRRGDDDQLGLVALEVAAAEERTEDGQVAEAGQLGDRLAHAVLHQAAQHHRAAGGKFERALGAAHLEAGNRLARAVGTGDCDGAIRRQLGHFGLDVQTDAALRQDDGSEGERHAEGLELDGDVAALVAAGGDRELAAGQERGVFAGDGGERRLGERLHHAGLLKRLDRRGERAVATGVADGRRVRRQRRRCRRRTGCRACCRSLWRSRSSTRRC